MTAANIVAAATSYVPASAARIRAARLGAVLAGFAAAAWIGETCAGFDKAAFRIALHRCSPSACAPFRFAFGGCALALATALRIHDCDFKQCASPFVGSRILTGEAGENWQLKGKSR